MNTRHRVILTAVFEIPTRAGIRWSDLETLFRALGATVSERAGSRVAITLNGRVRVFHRPHPKPEAARAVVQDVRDFLTQAGVTP